MRSVSGTRRRVPLICHAPLWLLDHHLRAYVDQNLLQGTWLNCVATVLRGPPRRAFLQESEHALASLVGDEQSRRLGAEPLGVAVKAVQDGGSGQCLGCGQPL